MPSRALPHSSPHECGSVAAVGAGRATFPQKQLALGISVCSSRHPGHRHPRAGPPGSAAAAARAMAASRWRHRAADIGSGARRSGAKSEVSGTAPFACDSAQRVMHRTWKMAQQLWHIQMSSARRMGSMHTMQSYESCGGGSALPPRVCGPGPEAESADRRATSWEVSSVGTTGRWMLSFFLVAAAVGVGVSPGIGVAGAE